MLGVMASYLSNRAVKFCPHCGSAISKSSIEGRKREAYQDSQCGFINWENSIPVVAALVELDGEYVVANNRAWPKGIFSLITGFLEKGELPEEAIEREVEEELGLETQGLTWLGNFGFSAKNQVLLAYEVKARGSVRLNHELRECKLLSRNELLSYDYGRLHVTKEIIAAWKNCNNNANNKPISYMPTTPDAEWSRRLLGY